MRTSRHSLRLLLILTATLIGVSALSPLPAAAAGTAELGIAVRASARVLRFSDTVTFTITVTNLGPDAATGVWVGLGTSDSLANFGGTCPDGTVSNMCDLGTLGSGDQVTVQIRAMACCACCPDRLGVAVADVSHDAETVDPNPANNRVRIEIKLVGKVR
jgi:hypothetical protein